MEQITAREVLIGNTFYTDKGEAYKIIDITYQGAETIGEILFEGEDDLARINLNSLLARIN